MNRLMAEKPTTGALLKAKCLTTEEVEAAVDAFMADPTVMAFLLGKSYWIDFAEAVCAHEWASVTVANKDATEHLKRTAVRTAIMLARPEEA